MSNISGGEVRLFLSADGGATYKAFAAETECSIELNADTRETTSKDIAVFRSYVTSAKSWTITGSSLLGDDDAAKWNVDELYGKVGDLVEIRITQVSAGTIVPVVGETKVEGDAILSQLSVSAPDKDNGTVSFTLNGTGAFTVGVNP
jgi:predicted secreted protein